MINWPTAMVLTAAILGGAVLYNKQGVAQFGGSGTALISNGLDFYVHAHGDKIRRCIRFRDQPVLKITCGEWY